MENGGATDREVGEEIDGISGEIISEASVERVNLHLLEKLDALILAAKEPEEIVTLTEALSKFNTSIRNNAIFTPEETAEDRNRRERTAAVADILKGDGEKR